MGVAGAVREMLAAGASREPAGWSGRSRAVAHAVRVAALAAGLLLAHGCGGTAGPGAPPPPTSPSPDGTTTSFTGTVAAYGIASHEYAPARDGMLTATLAWTGNADLDLYLTSADCTGYPPDACAILARSVQETGTREELTRAVRAGDRFKVWVDNLSPTVAVAYRLELTLQ